MKVRNVLLCIVGSALTLLLADPSANATLSTFSGSDPGTGPTNFPNSAAAEAAFLSAAGALGSVSKIDFESIVAHDYGLPWTITPGVTVTRANGIGNPYVYNTPFPISGYGWNTTPGGSKWFYSNGSSLTLNFGTPVSAFGCYFTGATFSGEAVQFNDGSDQSIAIPNTGTGIQFVGFTDQGKLISSVTLDFLLFDSWGVKGIDDISYVTVPEPTTWALLATALAMFGVTRCRVWMK